MSYFEDFLKSYRSTRCMYLGEMPSHTGHFGKRTCNQLQYKYKPSPASPHTRYSPKETVYIGGGTFINRAWGFTKFTMSMNRSSAVGFQREYLAIIVTVRFTDVGEHGLLVSNRGEYKSKTSKTYSACFNAMEEFLQTTYKIICKI